MGRILEFPRHAYRHHPVDELGLLVDGHDYYRQFYKAALTAKRSMVITGWQFDSAVPLLRGEDAEGVETPLTLLKFLNHLCVTKPELHIWILAWDFHFVFAAEREWMQKLMFHWSTHERLNFRFDSTHVERGCHHQKFVVIDGALSFLGGLDLCEDRWDERSHTANNPLRVSRGKPHKPFHDIQAFMRGKEMAGSLTELFARRWERTGGDPIAAELLAPFGSEAERLAIGDQLPIAATTVALSRTDPAAIPEGTKPCIELLALHQDAIRKAQRLIYAETQYMSSHAITEALEQRMRDLKMPKLEMVFILNLAGETLKETAAVGLAQAKNLGRLREVASETGHALGLFFTTPANPEPEQFTYIHSKLMIVDDRFLTVGSANLTNRSLGVDTELNVTVEADSDTGPLVDSIRKVRASLLAEHTGGPALELVEGLVASLGKATEQPGARLKLHPSPTESERTAIGLIDPQLLPWDPDHVEALDDERQRAFKLGIARTVIEMLSPRADKG